MKHRDSSKRRSVLQLLVMAVSTVVILGFQSAPATAQYKDGRKPAGVIEEVKETYICPATGLSINDSATEGALCPGGSKVLRIVGLMVDAGWSREDILSSMNIFVRGKSIRASVDTSGMPAIGDPDAPVTMVEFTDMQCPYCKRYNDTTFPALKKKYIDSGKVRYVQVNLPLPFHKNANKAAQSLYCAADQDKFWELRAMLFNDQKKLSVPDIKGYADDLGVDTVAFASCLDGGKYKERVNRDLSKARSAGINGTPGFVIAPTRKDGKITGNKLSGAQPAGTFYEAIDKVTAK